MQQIRNISLFIILLLLTSCIKEFDPVIDSNAANKYVISGRITNIEGFQEVEIALSSPIQSPKYIPVSGCTGMIEDDKGNAFQLIEIEPGQYVAWMRQIDLTPGTSYRLKITTSSGEQIESGYDKMQNGPPIDSIYYHINEVPTTDPNVVNQEMQFYVNLNAVGNYSQYYKWEIVETWEYHAPHAKEYYYDGMINQIIPPDTSNMYCWMTTEVKNVFTVSTKGLSQNIYNQYPLHAIDGHTSRLGILYSILVNQYALSEGAYNYWEQLRINSNEQGGLYEKQPLAIKGNLKNLTSPEKEVLGYFYAATTTSQRYFYHDVEGLYLDFNNYCYPEGLGKFGWKEFPTYEYPIYFIYILSVVKTLNTECYDCRSLGGVTVKPEFWPN